MSTNSVEIKLDGEKQFIPQFTPQFKGGQTNPEKRKYYLLDFAQLQKLANEGDPEAQLMYGLSCWWGLGGCNINKEIGNTWIISAAKSKDTPAGLCALGYCCLNGLGDFIVKNIETAKLYFKQAMEQNYIPAIYAYAHRLGQEEDEAEAQIHKGYAWNQHTGYSARDAALANLAIQHQDLRQGIMGLMAKCAQESYAPAQAYVAWCYYNGWGGCNKDLGEAARLYGISSKTGYAHARQWYGYLLRKGEGVAKNYEEGTHILEQAAAQGNKDAQDQLKEKPCCSIM